MVRVSYRGKQDAARAFGKGPGGWWWGTSLLQRPSVPTSLWQTASFTQWIANKQPPRGGHCSRQWKSGRYSSGKVPVLQKNVPVCGWAPGERRTWRVRGHRAEATRCGDGACRCCGFRSGQGCPLQEVGIWAEALGEEEWTTWGSTFQAEGRGEWQSLRPKGAWHSGQQGSHHGRSRVKRGMREGWRGAARAEGGSLQSLLGPKGCEGFTLSGFT